MEDINADVHLSSDGELENIDLGTVEEMENEEALESPRFKSEEENSKDCSETSVDADPAPPATSGMFTL